MQKHWLQPIWKFTVSMAILLMIIYGLLTADGDADRNVRIKAWENDKPMLKPIDLQGMWIESRKSDRWAIPGDRTKFLFISRLTDTDFTVQYKIDTALQFKEHFIYNGHELNGSVNTLLGPVQRRLIVADTGVLFFQDFVFRRVTKDPGH